MVRGDWQLSLLLPVSDRGLAQAGQNFNIGVAIRSSSDETNILEVVEHAGILLGTRAYHRSLV